MNEQTPAPARTQPAEEARAPPRAEPRRPAVTPPEVPPAEAAASPAQPATRSTSGPTPEQQIARIDALTRIARTTWFTLLAALLFVGLTLMAFRHIDYFDVTRSIELPFVNIPVSTRLFFIFAPVLVAAVYSYFHLYLIRLWHALGQPELSIDGVPLGERISPWLMSDAALFVRRRLADEEGAPGNSRDEFVERAAALANFALAWGFGIVVLLGAIFAILPVQAPLLTVFTVGSLTVACIFGAASLSTLFDVIAKSARDPAKARRWKRLVSACFVAIVGSTIALSGSHFVPATPPALRVSLDLAGAEIVPRPDDWEDHATARAVFGRTWCADQSNGACDELATQTAAMNDAWYAARQRTYAELPPPILPNRLDLTGANLTRVFWPVAYLDYARLSRADLSGARIEGANLYSARLEGADLVEARLEGADLRWARLEEANLFGARLEGADLSGARLEWTDLSGAQLEGADLSYLSLTAPPPEPNVGRRSVVIHQTFGDEGGVLLFRFFRTYLALEYDGDALRFRRFPTSEFSPLLELNSTNLSAVTNDGGALRFVNLRPAIWDHRSDFRNSFGDATVWLPDGVPRPCQWAGTELSDDQFFGRWRGWVEAAPNKFSPPKWTLIAPEGWEKVKAIPPPEGCVWHD